MDCFEFERELQERIDRGFAGDSDSLRTHRDDCPRCLAAWQQSRLLDEAIGVWRERLPEVDLVASVVARATQPEPPTVTAPRPAAPVLRPGRFGKRAVLAAAGVAAALLIWSLQPAREAENGGDLPAVASNANALDGQGVGTAPAPVEEARDPADLAAAASPPAVSAVAANVASLDEEPYGTLARSAIGVWEDFAWSIVPGRSAPPAAPRSADGHESTGAARSIDSEGWFDGLGHQLKPIGRGVGDAFDFLWQAGQLDNSRT